MIGSLVNITFAAGQLAHRASLFLRALKHHAPQHSAAHLPLSERLSFFAFRLGESPTDFFIFSSLFLLFLALGVYLLYPRLFSRKIWSGEVFRLRALLFLVMILSALPHLRLDFLLGQSYRAGQLSHEMRLRAANPLGEIASLVESAIEAQQKSCEVELASYYNLKQITRHDYIKSLASCRSMESRPRTFPKELATPQDSPLEQGLPYSGDQSENSLDNQEDFLGNNGFDPRSPRPDSWSLSTIFYSKTARAANNHNQPQIRRQNHSTEEAPKISDDCLGFNPFFHTQPSQPEDQQIFQAPSDNETTAAKNTARPRPRQWIGDELPCADSPMPVTKGA